MAKNVLIAIGDAAEALDTLYPFFRVREDGFEALSRVRKSASTTS